MASAQISETIRPAYIWTGEEWVQIGDGGSGTGGGGSVVGGTNIYVDYNEELNTYTVSASGALSDITSISTPDFIEFNTTYVPDNGMPKGSLYWNNEDQTLDFVLENEVVYQLGQEEHYPPVINNSGVQINRGELVMVTSIQGDKLAIAKAITDGTVDFNYIIGIAAHDIPDSADDATIIKFGYVNPVNTNSYAVGTILYPNPAVAGGLTDVKPDAPGYRIPIAIVTKQGTAGRILVRITSPSKLGESDSNVKFTGLENEDILVYNSASSLWVNNNIQNYINTASAAAAAYTDQEISDLIAGAPEALDTLNELAAALNDDENFASTVISTIGSASAFALSEASEYTDGVIDQLFIHEDHVKIQVQYDEELDKIIFTGEGLPKTSYGTTPPDFEGEEEEIYYQINAEKTKVINRYAYINGEWLLFSPDNATWEALGLQTWQWLLDNSEFGGWNYLLSEQTAIGDLDTNMRYLPNLIADIRFVKKNEFGDAIISGSSVVLNSLTYGAPTTNGSIKINRGNQDPVEIRWNESLNIWEFTEDGLTYKKLGSGAVLYEETEPDTSDLEIGTLWIDSDRDSTSGLQAQTFSRWIKELNTSASVFSGLDDDLTPLRYSPTFEQVFLNGTLIIRDVDYIANDGSSVTLLESAVEGDIVEIHSFEPFVIADSYTRDQIEDLFESKVSASDTYANKTELLQEWSEDESGNLLPSQDSEFSIGSNEYKVKDLYLSASSLYLEDPSNPGQTIALSVDSEGSLKVGESKLITESNANDTLDTSFLLTTNDASAIYLTQTNASNTYLTKTNNNIGSSSLSITTSANFDTATFTSSGSEANVGVNSTSTGGKNWRIVSGGSGGGFSGGNFGFYNQSDAIQSLFITPQGYARNSSQPYFYVRGAETNFTVTNGSNIPFNTAIHNVGNHFNTSTFRFTAPVSGKYLFCVSVFNNGGGGRLTIKVNNSSYSNLQMDYGASWSQSHVLSLAANDYVTVGDWQSISGAVVYMGHTHFSGILLA